MVYDLFCHARDRSNYQSGYKILNKLSVHRLHRLLITIKQVYFQAAPLHYLVYPSFFLPENALAYSTCQDIYGKDIKSLAFVSDC